MGGGEGIIVHVQSVMCPTFSKRWLFLILNFTFTFTHKLVAFIATCRPQRWLPTSMGTFLYNAFMLMSTTCTGMKRQCIPIDLYLRNITQEHHTREYGTE